MSKGDEEAKDENACRDKRKYLIARKRPTDGSAYRVTATEESAIRWVLKSLFNS